MSDTSSLSPRSTARHGVTGAIILASACVPRCGISSSEMRTAHMIGTANTAPIPPHTENQNTRLNKITTSFKPKPRRYTVGPRTSPTTKDPNAGTKSAHHR